MIFAVIQNQAFWSQDRPYGPYFLKTVFKCALVLEQGCIEQRGLSALKTGLIFRPKYVHGISKEKIKNSASLRLSTLYIKRYGVRLCVPSFDAESTGAKHMVRKVTFTYLNGLPILTVYLS